MTGSRTSHEDGIAVAPLAIHADLDAAGLELRSEVDARIRELAALVSVEDRSGASLPASRDS